jgi:poly-gamma-glutamate capsule biosynthesis protein CapA/YwtB (metallophosphatase superfamily)
MRKLFHTLLNRRAFVKSGAALSLLLVAGCDPVEDDDSEEATEDPTPTLEPEPDPTPQPDPTATPQPDPTATPTPSPSPTPTPEPMEPISYMIGEGLSLERHSLVARAFEIAQSVAAEHGLVLQPSLSEDQASLVISRPEEASQQALSLRGEPLVPVIRTDHLVDQIQGADLPRLFSRSIENWQELGGQDWIVHPAVSRTIVAPEIAQDSDPHSSDDLVALSRQHPGMISLIPRSAVNFRVQSLIVEDIDPIREELTSSNWPWWEEIRIEFDHSDSDLMEDLASEFEEESEEQLAPRRTMVSVVGDVMLGRTPHRIMVEQNDWTAPFPLVADELQRGDLTIGNLECAITDSFAPPADPSTFSFMTFTDAVEGLEFAGFHALSGANNHAMDFGVVGVQDTTEALEAAGIQHFGAGNNLEEAREPCLLEHDGVTFGFLGYDAISMHYAGATDESGGVAPMIREYVEEDIRRTRDVADVVIPYFHWGIEYTLTPTEGDRQMAHAAVDAGADLVLGGHPHWVQGMEIYNDTAIFYSTSNFVFDQEWSFETKQGFVLHLIFDGTSLAGYRVVPVLIEDFHRPRIVEDDVRATILGRFWESSSIIADTPI